MLIDIETVSPPFQVNQQFENVLMISIELCSLRLQTKPSRDNILANMIFADGAATASLSKKNYFFPLGLKNFVELTIELNRIISYFCIPCTAKTFNKNYKELSINSKQQLIFYFHIFV